MKLGRKLLRPFEVVVGLVRSPETSCFSNRVLKLLKFGVFGFVFGSASPSNDLGPSKLGHKDLLDQGGSAIKIRFGSRRQRHQDQVEVVEQEGPWPKAKKVYSCARDLCMPP